MRPGGRVIRASAVWWVRRIVSPVVGGAGLLSVGVGRHGAGNYNFSLGVNFG